MSAHYKEDIQLKYIPPTSELRFSLLDFTHERLCCPRFVFDGDGVLRLSARIPDCDLFDLNKPKKVRIKMERGTEGLTFDLY